MPRPIEGMEARGGGDPGPGRSGVLGVLAAAALLAACGPGNSPEGVARRFMDDYYVRVDLAGARGVVDGLASKKIEAQEALTRGQAVGSATEGRSVAYTLLGRDQDGDRHLFRYEVKVTLRGGGSFTRRSVLVVAPVATGWRVTNFDESNP